MWFRVGLDDNHLHGLALGGRAGSKRVLVASARELEVRIVVIVVMTVVAATSGEGQGG